MLSAARNHNSRGRGGRGRRNGRAGGQRNGGTTTTNGKKKDEKKNKKFHPLQKGKHPDSSFEDVKEELVLSLELSDLDKAEDIIDSTRDVKMIDLEAVKPVLQVSTAATRAQEERENDAFKETYRYEMKRWDSRVDALANNKRKLHAKILKFCSESMKFKLQQDSEYDTVLYRDPIELLKRIRKYMTTSEDTDWEFFTLWEAMKDLMSCRQAGNETPNEFRKRFEERAKVVKALLGDKFLDKFAEATQGYATLPGTGVAGIESDVQLEFKEKTWEMFLASGMLYNSDRARYQSRIDTMNANYMVIQNILEEKLKK